MIHEVFAGGAVIVSEWQSRNKNGEIGWRTGSAFPLMNGDGRAACGVIMMADITDRKHAEEALLRSEALLAAFMQNSPAVAFVRVGAGAPSLLEQGI